MILYMNKEMCCGCSACENICPQSAITLTPDSEGFLYPSISPEKCISCGQCQNVCPLQHVSKLPLHETSPRAYAAKHKDDNIRIQSSSGGVFTALSDYVLDHAGIVYGVMYDETMCVIHARATTKEQRDLFRGAKYVQSNLKHIFAQVNQDLKRGKLVLFSGTPCQVAGLKNYLGDFSANKLILCDIICHGVPSPQIWSNHIHHINKKLNSPIQSYYFRNKSHGWHTPTIAVCTKNKLIKNKSYLKTFLILYYANLINRPCCRNCKFANLNRCGDITIGDFWGIEKSLPTFDDNKGVSLLLINTPTGEHIFSNINSNLEFYESNLEDCLQPQLQTPNLDALNRQEFWSEFYKNGYLSIAKQYGGYGFWNQFKQFFIRIWINFIH